MRKVLIPNKGMKVIEKNLKKKPEMKKILMEAISKLQLEDFESTGNVSLLRGEEQIYVLKIKDNYRIFYTLEKSNEGDTIVLLLSFFQKKSNNLSNRILSKLWKRDDDDDDE